LLASVPEQEQDRWRAIINVNLSNLLWARAQLLEAAGQLPGGAPEDMRELGTPEELYRQAMSLQQLAHNTAMELPRPDRRPAATCLANISELNVLVGDYTAAERAAAACLQTICRDIDADIQGSALKLLIGEGEFYPENCWRV